MIYYAIDCRMDKRIIESLIKLDCRLIFVDSNPLFDDAVSAHPDMNILQIEDKIFKTTNVRLDCGELVSEKEKVGERLCYPQDVFLNAVCIGDDFICKKDSVLTKALEYATSCGMNVINVNQGYVKCNIVPVCEKNKAIITEDKGIAKVLCEKGYDVLMLQNLSVGLDPYKNGFIGGASGVIGDKIVFTGRISEHPEYCEICSFCGKYNKSVVELGNIPLYDYGSILKIEI